MRRSIVSLAALLLLLATTSGAAAYDNLTGYQWGLQQIHAPAAWQVSSGAGVTVGVVDTGADTGHPDFGGRVSMVDCLNNCSPASDDPHGHGTHVTGIIAAANDGSGTTGVAPGTNVIVADAFTGESAYEEDIERAVDYLISRGVVAINLSLGDDGLLGIGLFCDNGSLQGLLNKIWNAGVIPVFAAGNCGGGGGNYAGVNALIVGATNSSGGRASYSNDMRNAQWGLTAPGGDAPCNADFSTCVLSTWPRALTPSGKLPYTDLAGTSMATPHVTGAVAVLRARGYSQQDTVNRIMSNLDGASCGTGCRGRLNVQRAVGAADVAPPAPPGPPPSNVVSTPSTRPLRTTSATTAPRPKPTVAPVVVAPVETTTTTEPPPTTTAPPPVAVPALQSAAPARTGDDSGLPLWAGALAVVGLLAAGAATAFAGWRVERAKAAAEL